MPHSLIVGQTGSGKTTLARLQIARYRASGIHSLVLDPLCDIGWNAAYCTDNPDEFLAKVWQSRKCALFIDEAAQAVGRYAGPMGMLATRSRHWGHNAHFLVQRAALLDRTVRDQCEIAYVFRVSRYDAEVLSDEYCYESISQACTLDKGQFLLVRRYGGVTRYSAFRPNEAGILLEK